MRKLAATFLLAFICINCFAQQKVVDSLKRLIQTAKDDTSKATNYRKLGIWYTYLKPDSALLLFQQALKIDQKEGYLLGQAKSMNCQGNAYYVTGNYSKSLAAYLSGLKISEQLNDRASIGSILGNISNVYSAEGDERQSLNFTIRAKAIYEDLHNEKMLTTALSNLGDSYTKLNILDSGLIYTRKGLEHALKVKNTSLIGNSNNNMGNIYAELHKTDSALYYYRKAIPLLTRAGNDDAKSETTIGMAKVFLELGIRDSSLFYARQSVAAGWHGGFTARVLAASQFLTSYFKQQGQLDSAFHYQEVSIAAKDSLFSQQKTHDFQNLTFAERQRQTDIQERDAAYRANIRFYLLIAITVFLLVLAFIFWRNNRKNEKARRLLQTQKEQIQTTLGELKSTQNQLVQSAKMASLGELTAGIAHEIQNPLNFVNNFSEVSVELLEELKTEAVAGHTKDVITIADDLKHNLEKIGHHGKRADFIVKGMLEHSRTTTGEKQLTNLNVLADEFFKLSYHGLRAKDKKFNAELVTHFDEKLPKVKIAQQDIGRVLLNLFSNAFYAVNEKAKTAGPDYKPEVEVSTEAENGAVVFKVKDNGNGIPDNIREKIMQPFFTTKPTGEGTGLGLSLSYDIVVKGHAGSINVNTKEGEFTEFVVSLPI